jgi:hypothetical protein
VQAFNGECAGLGRQLKRGSLDGPKLPWKASMLRIGTEEYFNSFEQFRTHLPVGKEDDLLILKGHLLIERLIERFHEQNLARPTRLANARLTFAQKLAVASALRFDPGDDWLWEAVAGLNRLRNELTHRLPSPRFDELRQQFISLVESSPELPELEPPTDLHEQLHRAIFSLHDAVSRRVDT